MGKFLLILLFFHVSSSEKHSLQFFFSRLHGTPGFPNYIGKIEVDQVQAAYCDSKKMELKQDWVKTMMHTNQDHMNWYHSKCFGNQPHAFEDMMNNLMQSFNQSKGVHVLQRISGCEWDNETGEVNGFMKFGYDGEDILSFDVVEQTWTALKPEAISLKLRWDAERRQLKLDKIDLTLVFPEWLKKYIDLGKSTLMRKVLPSVSLLQKSPSSPITCHATGFYPNSAVLFWRKDGEELFEDVEHGEILPNQDGSFQMSVELLKLPPEDWGKYECVFQLSGVKEDMVTKLEKSVIRTNYMGVTNIGLMLLFWVLATPVVGFMFYMLKKEEHRTKTLMCIFMFTLILVVALVGFLCVILYKEDLTGVPVAAGSSLIIFFLVFVIVFVGFWLYIHYRENYRTTPLMCTFVFSLIEFAAVVVFMFYIQYKEDHRTILTLSISLSSLILVLFVTVSGCMCNKLLKEDLRTTALICTFVFTLMKVVAVFEFMLHILYYEVHENEPLVFLSLSALIMVLVVAVVGFRFYRRCKAPKTRTEEPETLNHQTIPLNNLSSTQQREANEEEETLNTEPVG